MLPQAINEGEMSDSRNGILRVIYYTYWWHSCSWWTQGWKDAGFYGSVNTRGVLYVGAWTVICQIACSDRSTFTFLFWLVNLDVLISQLHCFPVNKEAQWIFNLMRFTIISKIMPNWMDCIFNYFSAVLIILQKAIRWFFCFVTLRLLPLPRFNIFFKRFWYLRGQWINKRRPIGYDGFTFWFGGKDKSCHII